MSIWRATPIQVNEKQHTFPENTDFSPEKQHDQSARDPVQSRANIQQAAPETTESAPQQTDTSLGQYNPTIHSMMDLDKSGVSTVSTISFLDGPDSTTITTDSAADTEVLFQFLSEATAVNRPHHPQALYMGDSPIHSPPQLHLQGKEDVLELNQELAFFPVTVHDNSPLPLDRTEPRPGPSMVQSSTNTDTVLSPTGASNASSCIFFPPTSSALHQKRRKAKRHAIRTPRPKNCFMIYRSHISPMIMVEYGMLNSTLISRIAGERWQAEPESVRAWYRRVAKKGKEEHERIHPGYKYAPHKRMTFLPIHGHVSPNPIWAELEETRLLASMTPSLGKIPCPEGSLRATSEHDLVQSRTIFDVEKQLPQDCRLVGSPSDLYSKQTLGTHQSFCESMGQLSMSNPLLGRRLPPTMQCSTQGPQTLIQSSQLKECDLATAPLTTFANHASLSVTMPSLLRPSVFYPEGVNACSVPGPWQASQQATVSAGQQHPQQYGQVPWPYVWPTSATNLSVADSSSVASSSCSLDDLESNASTMTLVNPNHHSWTVHAPLFGKAGRGKVNDWPGSVSVGLGCIGKEHVIDRLQGVSSAVPHSSCLTCQVTFEGLNSPEDPQEAYSKIYASYNGPILPSASAATGGAETRFLAAKTSLLSGEEPLWTESSLFSSPLFFPLTEAGGSGEDAGVRWNRGGES